VNQGAYLSLCIARLGSQGMHSQMQVTTEVKIRLADAPLTVHYRTTMTCLTLTHCLKEVNIFSNGI